MPSRLEGNREFASQANRTSILFFLARSGGLNVNERQTASGIGEGKVKIVCLSAFTQEVVARFSFSPAFVLASYRDSLEKAGRERPSLGGTSFVLKVRSLKCRKVGLPGQKCS